MGGVGVFLSGWERGRDSLLMVWVGERERERFFIDGMGGMGTETVK